MSSRFTFTRQAMADALTPADAAAGDTAAAKVTRGRAVLHRRPAGFDGQATSSPSADAGKAMRVAAHHFLVNRIPLSLVQSGDRPKILREAAPLVREFVRINGYALTSAELDALAVAATDELVGFGPLEPLLKDESVSDILVNGPHRVFVERNGLLERSTVSFDSDAHLLQIIQKIVARVGRRIDEANPMADARLPDGSRFNAAIPPLAIDGPLVSIRKFSRRLLLLDDLVASGTLDPAMATLLAVAVRSRVSIVIAGGTGSGKTTLLNALSSEIQDGERLITIEDAAELQLQQSHVVRLETRAPNVEGTGEVRQRELLRNALRMRPDRIIIGEVRGEEAFDMMQAMNTGHEGSMTTVHANNPRDTLARIEQMIGMAGLPMSAESIREQVAAAVRLVVHIARLSDGSRRITSISELLGLTGDAFKMQEIFRFRESKRDETGRIHGRYVYSGVRPNFASRVHGADAAALDAHLTGAR